MPDEVAPGDEPEPMAEQDGGTYLPEHPLDLALRALGKGASVADRLEVVWAAYEAATGSTLTRPPLEAERQVVAAWVRTPDAVGNRPSFFAQDRGLTPLLHESVVRKASRLTQAHCFSCTPAPSTSGPLGVSFPIGIEPWAAQSSQDKVAIRQAVTAALQRQGRHRMPWGGSPVCLSVTALVPRPSRAHRRKDVDNLVKGLIDALQGYLFQNDDAVQHLNIRRLEYAGTVGCYFVGAQPVAAPDADVIYDDPKPPRLMINHVEYPEPPAGPPTPPS